MNFSRSRLRFVGLHLNSQFCKCVAFVAVALSLILTSGFLLSCSGSGGIRQANSIAVNSHPSLSNLDLHTRTSKFLEVPQIVWGLNNQKIALARACLTARMLNRTLLMPSLSSSLFYKEINLLKPIPFDEVFQFDEFNSACKGFVRLARYSEVTNSSNVKELHKGSGRRWTIEKDVDQLQQFSKHHYDEYEIIKVVGKNPFLWHDHWSVKEYAKIFKCFVLEKRISGEADKVVSRLRQVGLEESLRVGLLKNTNNVSSQQMPYIAVHMRIEKDWMIHCKKLEQRLNINEICSNRNQIVQRVGNISGLKTPILIYLAVADNLLEDNSILSDWKEGLLPFEKKKLGVLDIYKKQPYLFQSAIDYEVCLRSDVFVGNSFSTFSSLVVLDRTQRMLAMGSKQLCGKDVRWPSYAYNLKGESHGPRPWATNMSDNSLEAISYGSNQIFCS